MLVYEYPNASFYWIANTLTLSLFSIIFCWFFFIFHLLSVYIAFLKRSLCPQLGTFSLKLYLLSITYISINLLTLPYFTLVIYLVSWLHLKIHSWLSEIRISVRSISIQDTPYLLKISYVMFVKRSIFSWFEGSIEKITPVMSQNSSF